MSPQEKRTALYNFCNSLTASGIHEHDVKIRLLRDVKSHKKNYIVHHSKLTVLFIFPEETYKYIDKFNTTFDDEPTEVYLIPEGCKFNRKYRLL